MVKLDSGSKVAAFVSIGIGIILLVPAALNFASRLSFVTHAEKTDAVFLGADLHQTAQGGRYFSEFTFKTKDGRTVTYATADGTRRPRLKKGQTVPILYDPGDPDRAKLDSPFNLWLATFVIGAPAVLFILMGSLIFILGARRVNRIDEILDDTIE